MNAQEIVNHLSNQWTQCPDSTKYHQGNLGAADCPTCHGTNRVPRYPTLVEPCIGIHIIPTAETHRSIRMASHAEVGCSGYHPKWAKDVHKEHVEWEVANSGSMEFALRYVKAQAPERQTLAPTLDQLTPEVLVLAALRALYAADQAVKQP